MKDAELLTYKGYFGSISVNQEDACLHGRIEFIADLVTYEGDTVPDLKKAFEAAVDDYLATCAEVGKQPLKSCSGTFNVRIGSELHMAALIAAKQANTSLNDFVKQAISDKVAHPLSLAPLHPQAYCAAESGESVTQASTAANRGRSRKKTPPLYPAGDHRA
ncbi:MAG: type II toxin-antitoxin system HicB family antitoxin [bacterium]